MKTLNSLLILFLLLSVFISEGCKKEFLEKKPATNINVPSTFADLQLLLDNLSILNTSPSLSEISNDDFEMGFTEWMTPDAIYEKNAYVWEKDVFQGKGDISHWNMPYKGILTANVVLAQLDNINRDDNNKQAYDNLKGMALFSRAYLYFNLAETFTVPYDKTRASTDLGLPLRLTPDINQPTIRSTVEQSFRQILSDALTSIPLLQLSYNSVLNRPSKAAGYGLVSRIYLSMQDYQKAGLYADSALKLHGNLMDYNQVSKTSTTPFALASNSELLYDARLISPGYVFFLYRSANYSIAQSLYNSYNDNDLRKIIFFTKTGTTVNLKGGYSGLRSLSNGIATDELYLTRAECNARDGKLTEAMADLNTLIKTRWNSSVSYPNIIASSQADALQKILLERRKELVMRGLRWSDLRRLNKEGYNITISRTLNGTIYTLPPNDPRYALPIPPDVIARSGIQQNNR